MYTNEELEILPSDKLTADKPSDDTELSGANSGLASSLLLQSTDTLHDSATENFCQIHTLMPMCKHSGASRTRKDQRLI